MSSPVAWCIGFTDCRIFKWRRRQCIPNICSSTHRKIWGSCGKKKTKMILKFGIVCTGIINYAVCSSQSSEVLMVALRLGMTNRQHSHLTHRRKSSPWRPGNAVVEVCFGPVLCQWESIGSTHSWLGTVTPGEWQADMWTFWCHGRNTI